MQVLYSFSLALILAIGAAGIGVMSMAPPAFDIARVSFAIAGIWAAIAGGIFLYESDFHQLFRYGFGAALGLVVFIFLPETLRWVSTREAEWNAAQSVSQYGATVEAMRASQDKDQQASSLTKKILDQWDQLNHATSLLEHMRSRKNDEERVAVAERISADLRIALNGARLMPLDVGDAVVLKTGQNTFRVTFSVAMANAGKLAFYNLPSGITPNVVEQSPIGFTVLFAPQNIPVETFDFTADTGF